MACVVEGSVWDLTEPAAEFLVKQGILRRCYSEHLDISAVSLPVYHLSSWKPMEVGTSTLQSYINQAEKAVQELDTREEVPVNKTVTWGSLLLFIVILALLIWVL